MARDHAAAMIAYATLAAVSHGKQQGPTGDRFLLLCAAEACRGGWLDVASCAHSLLRVHQPGHLVSRQSSMPAAMRDAACSPVIERWSRWCSYERAEQLLKEAGIVSGMVPPATDMRSAGEVALAQLATIEQPPT